MSTNSNTVVQAAPPAPPGPATYDTSQFKGNAGTVMIDSQTKSVKANYISTGRLRVLTDPAKPDGPGILCPTIATQILYAPDVQPDGNIAYHPSLLVANSEVHVVNAMSITRSLIVGERAPFPKIPTFSVIYKGGINMANKTFAQAAQLNGGQVIGSSILYCDGPRANLSTVGRILDLNGSTISGTAVLYN